MLGAVINAIDVKINALYRLVTSDTLNSFSCEAENAIGRQSAELRLRIVVRRFWNNNESRNTSNREVLKKIGCLK